MAICDYCGNEFEDGDNMVHGVDFCCNECCEEVCEVCGDPISPATSENYFGRCYNCAGNEYEE